MTGSASVRRSRLPIRHLRSILEFFTSRFASSCGLLALPFLHDSALAGSYRNPSLEFAVFRKMGIFLDEPKFPVIERNPTAASTVSNFSFSDYVRITAITGASLPVGYLAGGSVNIRGPSMYTAGIIGLMGGFMYAYQCSAGRLMGMFPNDDEVARHKR